MRRVAAAVRQDELLAELSQMLVGKMFRNPLSRTASSMVEVTLRTRQRRLRTLLRRVRRATGPTTLARAAAHTAAPLGALLWRRPPRQAEFHVLQFEFKRKHNLVSSKT